MQLSSPRLKKKLISNPKPDIFYEMTSTGTEIPIGSSSPLVDGKGSTKGTFGAGPECEFIPSLVNRKNQDLAAPRLKGQ